jgi:hypothetical protein
MNAMNRITHPTNPLYRLASYQYRLRQPTPSLAENHSARRTAFQPMITANRKPANR